MNRLIPSIALTGLILWAPVHAYAAAASVEARVESITEDYGNLNTDVSWEQVFDLGLERGSVFTISFEGKTFDVYLGTTYGDVPRGDWVGFIMENGMLRLARNFENAAKTLGCQVGDTIVITSK